jgi:hypothetical protein
MMICLDAPLQADGTGRWRLALDGPLSSKMRSTAEEAAGGSSQQHRISWLRK